jgi:hypothetical protein
MQRFEGVTDGKPVQGLSAACQTFRLALPGYIFSGNHLICIIHKFYQEQGISLINKRIHKNDKKLCFLALPEFTAKTVFMNNSG